MSRRKSIEALVEASSLGTPAAKAIRAKTSRKTVARVLKRAEDLERTNRGFAIYARVPTVSGGTLRVQKSSSVGGDEPRLWLFLDGEECVEHLGRHQKPDPHLSLSQARLLRDALSAFIKDSK